MVWYQLKGRLDDAYTKNIGTPKLSTVSVSVKNVKLILIQFDAIDILIINLRVPKIFAFLITPPFSILLIFDSIKFLRID